MSKRKELVA